MSVSIAIFGGAGIDRVALTDGRPVSGASNPGRLTTAPGGVGFNVACVLARLGATVRLVARIGKDPDGDIVLNAAAQAGIATGAVTRSAISPTATYLAVLDDNRDLVVGVADMAVHDELTPEILEPVLSHAAGDAIWMIDANLPAASLAAIAARARRLDKRLVALPVSPAKAMRLLGILAEIDLLIANRREAAMLLGEPSAEPGRPPSDLARDLRPRLRQGGAAIVTDAGGPLALSVATGVTRFTPLPAEPSSVNGAGDAFAGAVIHGLAIARPLADAVSLGLAAAALTVEREGTIPADLTGEAIAARLRQAGR